MNKGKCCAALAAFILAGCSGSNFSDTNYKTTSNESKGYQSEAWLVFSADACDSRDQAAYINNGEEVSTLSSEYFSCTLYNYGTEYIYSFEWGGDDFDRDGENDTLSFDIKVEAFDGSSFSYSETAGESSVDALGNEAALDYTVYDNGTSDDDSDVSGYWDIADDGIDGIAEGQSLRFTVENIVVSASDYSAEFNGFDFINVMETNGGNTHTHIRGFGTGLNSGSFSTATNSYSFDATDEFIITGAGDYYESRVWSITDIQFSFSISNPNLTSAYDDYDYSIHKTGPDMTDVYPEEESDRQAMFPEFSWDTVPRWLAVRNAGAYTDEQIDTIAGHYQLVMLEKANKAGFDTVDEGIKDTAARLKAENPDIKTIFYWNTVIHYTGYSNDAEYEANANDWSVLNDDGSIYMFKDLYYTYNASIEALRDWWIELPIEMANDDNIDGVFIDKMPDAALDEIFIDGEPATDYVNMINMLWEGIPDDKMLMGNDLRNERNNASRAMMEILDGSYLERWHMPNTSFDTPSQNTADAIAVSITLMREAAAQGKFINFQTSPENFTDDEMPDSYEDRAAFMEEHVDFPLAVYLIAAEEGVFFSYQDGVNAADEDSVWDTSYMDVFNRSLGEPLGAPVRDGYIYTRSFEYVDVWVDLETFEAELTWYDEPQSAN
ncbi:putative glycoside hydrolase [Reinekea marinisedimentorum]|uniref:Putative glycosyl hydrolase-like family 15 (GHL15) protein n=1 Tax=Reinekea marinisedimentorum TaxID=230495 RepID=A0A4R3ICE3_9GAMM|nr:putative glycoside hydrolase [Reinekea marinisedimentorum]TCS43295.1 putative glycosyl hydrolase-like family 15 (GHL15) protein [Reinekea marinisedimentorum]